MVNENNSEQALAHLRNIIPGLMQLVAGWNEDRYYGARAVFTRGEPDEDNSNLVYLQCFVAQDNGIVTTTKDTALEHEFVRIPALPSSTKATLGIAQDFDLAVPANDNTAYSVISFSVRELDTKTAGLRAMREIRLQGYGNYPEELFIKVKAEQTEYFRVVCSWHTVIMVICKHGFILLPTDIDYDSTTAEEHASAFMPLTDIGIEKVYKNFLDTSYKLNAEDRDFVAEAIEDWNRDQYDPLIDDDELEGRQAEFICGSEEALREWLLHIHNVCSIDPAFGSSDELRQVCVRMATDTDPAHLELDSWYDYDCSDYLDKHYSDLVELALEQNTPEGWSWEYNDGAHNRKSGYDVSAGRLDFTFSKPSEHEILRSINILRRKCKELGVALPQHLQTKIEQIQQPDT